MKPDPTYYRWLATTWMTMFLVAMVPAGGQCLPNPDTSPDQPDFCFEESTSEWQQSTFRNTVADFDLCIGGSVGEPQVTGKVHWKKGKYIIRKFGQNHEDTVAEVESGKEWIGQESLEEIIRHVLVRNADKISNELASSYFPDHAPPDSSWISIMNPSVYNALFRNDTYPERLQQDQESMRLRQWIDQMNITLKVRVDRNVFFINREYPELEIALEGELELVKPPLDSIQIYGSLNMPNGYVRSLNRHFQLEKGAMKFRGDPQNPELNIRTLYQPAGAPNSKVILFTMKGEAARPEFGYYREEERGIQEIITYDLLGISHDRLTEWWKVLSGQSNDNLTTFVARELLNRREETLAIDRIGIDHLEIYNAGNTSGLKMGKNIMNELVMTYSQDLDGQIWKRQVLLQYQLGPHNEMSVTASDFKGGTALIQWKYDY